jgi:Ca2+-binding EF-hand superfamily protein
MWVVALAAAAGMATTGAFAHDKAMGDMMSAVDTNHDGMVSAAEHAAHAKAMFEKIDANHDGMVDKAEMEAGMKMMRDRMGHDDHMSHGAMDKDDGAMKHETTPTK